MHIVKGLAVAVVTGIVGFAGNRLQGQSPSSPPRPVGDLRLSDLVQHVLERNEHLQVKLLDFEVARHKYLAERGIFEPAAYANVSRQEDNRQNSSIQAGALLG